MPTIPYTSLGVAVALPNDEWLSAFGFSYEKLCCLHIDIDLDVLMGIRICSVSLSNSTSSFLAAVRLAKVLREPCQFHQLRNRRPSKVNRTGLWAWCAQQTGGRLLLLGVLRVASPTLLRREVDFFDDQLVPLQFEREGVRI